MDNRFSVNFFSYPKGATPARDVHHPREKFYEMCPGKSRPSQACNKIVDGLDTRVQLGGNRWGVINDRHDHGRGGSAKMLVPCRGLGKETAGEQNCFVKLRDLERFNDGFAEAFMGSLAHFTPPVAVSTGSLVS
jgi:hypothetical protein